MTAVAEAPPVRRKFVVKAGRHNQPVPAALVEGPNADDPFGHKRMKNRVETFTQGQEVESDDDLIAKFPGKFALAAEPKQVSEERRQAVTDLLKTSTWMPEDRDYLEAASDEDFDRIKLRTTFKQQIDKVQSALGNDVTNQFPAAYDNQYLVFVNAEGKHQIVKKGASTKPINKTPLEAAAVEGFIADLLK